MLQLFRGKSIFLILLLSAVLFSSCIREEEAPPRSLEQIQAEEGVPVHIVEIKKGNMGSGLQYYAKIRGWKETTEGASVGDEIVKINAKIGDWVNAGDIIVEFPINSPTMQLKQSEIQLETVALTQQRAKKLLDVGEMSQQKYDEIDMQYKIAKRNVESLKKFLKVEASISGYVVSMPYKVGDIPESGKPLFTVAKLDKMIAQLSVSDSEIGQIRKGLKATCNWQGKDYQGTITDVSIAIDPYTQAFPVEITFANSNKELRPGTTVNITIQTGISKDVIVVPQKAVVKVEKENYVYLAKNNQAVLQKVVLGKKTGLDVEITEGLNEGDKMINCCFNLLEDGKKIKIVE